MRISAGAVAAGWVMATAMGAANALTVAAGNNVQPDQSNVMHEACGLPSSTNQGPTIVGCLNDGHTQLVDVASDESLIWAGGGQARVEAEGSAGAFSQLMLSAAGSTLSSVILNINASGDGFVQFSDGSSTSTLFALSGNGQNFFTITGGPFTTLSIKTFSDAAGTVEADLLQDVRQIRLAVTTPVPEPETYALMLAGLAAVGFIGRRRRRE